MALYQNTVNIWALNKSQRQRLQVGQWVRAGLNGALGTWCGETPSSSVVAWQENARHHKSRKAYIRGLINYAKSRNTMINTKTTNRPTLAQELQFSSVKASKLTPTNRSHLIINTLGGLFGALLVVLCTIVLTDGSL